MKNKSKGEFIPADRHETDRKEIIHELEGQILSAREISGIVSISEKMVYNHLYHIRKSINKKEFHLVITPSRCRKCGFSFKKRERLEKPGKCPVCRNEWIEEPLFTIK